MGAIATPACGASDAFQLESRPHSTPQESPMAARRTSSARSKPPLDVDALWALKRIGAPTIAPGGRLACAPVTTFSFDRNAGHTELWLFATGYGAGSATATKPR